MAKQYQVNTIRKQFNRLMQRLIGWGLAPKNMVVLHVTGRKSGKSYATPVSLLEVDGNRYLVSPYGETNWVKNARAAGQIALSRKGHSEVVQLEEVDAVTSAPLLKTYINREKITQPYFDVKSDEPLEAFVLEAPRHPVFRLMSK